MQMLIDAEMYIEEAKYSIIRMYIINCSGFTLLVSQVVALARKGFPSPMTRH